MAPVSINPTSTSKDEVSEDFVGFKILYCSFLSSKPKPTKKPIETKSIEPVFQEILWHFTFPCHFRTLIGRANAKLTLPNFSALTQWNHTQGWQMSGSSIPREVKQTGVCYPPSFRKNKILFMCGDFGVFKHKQGFRNPKGNHMMTAQNHTAMSLLPLPKLTGSERCLFLRKKKCRKKGFHLILSLQEPYEAKWYRTERQVSMPGKSNNRHMNTYCVF